MKNRTLLAKKRVPETLLHDLREYLTALAALHMRRRMKKLGKASGMLRVNHKIIVSSVGSAEQAHRPDRWDFPESISPGEAL